MATTSPPRSGAPLPSTFRWRIRVLSLKIEDTTFTVDRHALVKASPVIRNMLTVRRSEGQLTSESHPVELEGYKARDFEALLKVLYPAPQDVESGKFPLAKDEWIGVFKLARALEMKTINQIAKRGLSGHPDWAKLSGIEKVHLGRDLGVAEWLIDGLGTLIYWDRDLSPDNLEKAVGLRCAFRILALRESNYTGKRIPALDFELSHLHCSSCRRKMMPSSGSRCGWCRTNGNRVFVEYSQSRHSYDGVTGFIHIRTSDLLCLVCYGKWWHEPRRCENCHREDKGWVYVNQPEKDRVVSHPSPPSGLIEEIEKTFKDELAQCDM